MTALSNFLSRSVRMLIATLLFSSAVTSAFAGSETVLHNFISFAGGFGPSNVVVDVDGSLYFPVYWGSEHGNGAILKLAQDENGKWAQTVIYSFQGSAFNDGQTPVSLLLDGQGSIYGVTAYGGQNVQGGACNSCGTAFKLTRHQDGTWSETVLHSFGSTSNDGRFPEGPIVMDAAGNLYGSASVLGQYGKGMVFELRPTSSGQWVETIVYSFTGGADGNEPTGGIVADASGNLYGMTLNGGDPQCSCGVVFQLHQDAIGAWQQNVLHTFHSASLSNPAGIAIDKQGKIYGTTGNSVFEVAQSSGGTWVFRTLHTLATPDGIAPNFLLTDQEGNIYGTAWGGGSTSSTCGDGCGTVFRLTNPDGPDSGFSVLYSFQDASDGMVPDALAFGPAGQLYGVTQLGGHLAGTPYGNNLQPIGSGTAFSLSEKSGAWSHTKIATLPASDGTMPVAGLISDGRGNLYGTVSESGPKGWGAIFELEHSGNGSWTEKLLYSFTEGPASLGNLTFDARGNLYGTTEWGAPAYSLGTVFRLTPSSDGSWSSSILYNFIARSNPNRGAYPNGGLVIDAAGNVYGTTPQGGAGSCTDLHGYLIGCGVVFMLSENSNGSWSETVLHSFAGAHYDGAAPLSGLVIGPRGELYGTTSQGGTGLCYNRDAYLVGCGVVYRLLPNGSGGWTFSILHNFQGTDGSLLPTNGSLLNAGVTLAPDGTLYGAAPYGGPAGYGVVYRLTSSTSTPWPFTPLYGFGAFAWDGRTPAGNLALDRDGNVYGVTENGGAVSCGYLTCGTVFKLIPQSSGGWTEEIVHDFGGSVADGSFPWGGVLLDEQGNIFGTTTGGGQASGYVWNYPNGGTVFEIASWR